MPDFLLLCCRQNVLSSCGSHALAHQLTGAPVVAQHGDENCDARDAAGSVEGPDLGLFLELEQLQQKLHELAARLDGIVQRRAETPDR